jgi:hypothetical protein
MPPLVPLGPRARVAAAFVAAAGCVAAAAGVAACLTAPPPDISPSTNERPLIIHTPPEGLLNIDGWPPDDTFRIPVLLPDPNATCQWQLFDKDLEGTTTPTNGQVCDTSVEDGGVIELEVPSGRRPTDGHCHVFTFIVAHAFSATGVPDSIGGDDSIWEYEPPEALCNFYDAGALQDGAFPPDAGVDGPLVTPESGPLPESGVDP